MSSTKRAFPYMPATSLKPVHTLKGHSKWIRTVAELDSRGTIVTASQDQTVKLWSLSDVWCERTFTSYDDQVADIAVVDETTILTVSGVIVRVLNTTNGYVRSSTSFPNNLISCAVLGQATAVVADVKGGLFKIDWNSGDIKTIAAAYGYVLGKADILKITTRR